MQAVTTDSPLRSQCSISRQHAATLLWDAAFGTLKPLRADEPVEFGITRPVDDGSFWGVHFGEFVELLRDMRNASSLHESIAYALRAPDWQPGDVSQPAVAMRLSWLAGERDLAEARADSSGCDAPSVDSLRIARAQSDTLCSRETRGGRGVARPRFLHRRPCSLRTRLRRIGVAQSVPAEVVLVGLSDLLRAFSAAGSHRSERRVP